jgi:hypothetical protein
MSDLFLHQSPGLWHSRHGKMEILLPLNLPPVPDTHVHIKHTDTEYTHGLAYLHISPQIHMHTCTHAYIFLWSCTHTYQHLPPRHPHMSPTRVSSLCSDQQTGRWDKVHPCVWVAPPTEAWRSRQQSQPLSSSLQEGKAWVGSGLGRRTLRASGCWLKTRSRQPWAILTSRSPWLACMPDLRWTGKDVGEIQLLRGSRC